MPLPPLDRARRLRSVAAGALALAMAPAVARGQDPAPLATTADLFAVVRDVKGGAVHAAEVGLQGILGRGRTDDSGRVLLQRVPAGTATLLVRRMGFTPHAATIELVPGRTTSVAVVLAAAVQELDEVVVTGRRGGFGSIMQGFYDRQASGIGQFITRGQIAERRPIVMSDMVRTVPGMRMMWVNGQSVVRFSRSMGRGMQDCPPQYWIDGMRTDHINIDSMQPADIEGIEFYGLSSTPPQFLSRTGTSVCGAIVIWTRRPGG